MSKFLEFDREILDSFIFFYCPKIIRFGVGILWLYALLPQSKRGAYLYSLTHTKDRKRHWAELSWAEKTELCIDMHELSWAEVYFQSEVSIHQPMPITEKVPFIYFLAVSHSLVRSFFFYPNHIRSFYFSPNSPPFDIPTKT